jgi:prefoldin alpha subunit
MNQEQLMKFQMIEQEAQQLNQQLQLIEQNISEIFEIKTSLEEIEKKESKEILANLGKKIYIPVEIKEKHLIVEVGNKKLVKKSFSETKELVSEQLNKLDQAKMHISNRLESLQSEAERLMLEMEKNKGEREMKIKKHKHGPNCEHHEEE